MISDRSPSDSRRRDSFRIAGAAVAVLAALAVLGGCSTTKRQDITGSVPDDYRIVHPIRIDEQLATMDIPVGRDTAGLSGPVKSNIVGFAQRFRASDSAFMALVVPTGSPNEIVATSIGHEVYDVLVRAGVKPSALEIRRYRAGAKDTVAPIRLAYNRLAARVDGCGAWPNDLDKDPGNRNYRNFGCASQANLAAMVDNPLDLLYPRGSTPPDATRRSTVLENYGKGEVYSAKQRLETGEVVKGVGN